MRTLEWQKLHAIWVSFETSYDLKLEQKLILSLSEIKLLFRLFRFHVETMSFIVSIKTKQKETNQKKLKRSIFLKNIRNIDFSESIRSTAACAAHWHDCPTAACAALGRVFSAFSAPSCHDVSVQQQPVLPLSALICLLNSSLFYPFLPWCVCSTAAWLLPPETEAYSLKNI